MTVSDLPHFVFPRVLKLHFVQTDKLSKYYLLFNEFVALESRLKAVEIYRLVFIYFYFIK